MDYNEGESDQDCVLASSPIPFLPRHYLDMGILNGSDDSDVGSEIDDITAPGHNVIIDETSDDDPDFVLSDSDLDDSDGNPTSPETPSALDREEVMESEVNQSTNAQEPVPEGRVKVKKRLRRPENWTRNVKKSKRERGEAYVDASSKPHVARSMKSQCKNGCTFKCNEKLTLAEREKFFKHFWKLSEDKKLHFYAKFVAMRAPKRKRSKNEAVKLISFEYFLECSGAKIRVCREFFLTTLDVSRQRIYYFFKHNYNASTGVALSPKKGLHVKKQTAEEVIDSIKLHISSFPVMESHYCRASTEKKYLDSSLNITKMFQLYLNSEFVIPNKPVVKSHQYRHIFNTQFNLSFFQPKKDRCDTCEAIKHVKNPTQDEQDAYTHHISQKLAAKEERDKDRALYKLGQPVEGDSAVLAFDMQNVFSLPKAEISNFFYKRKFNCYNLTAHCSFDGVTYCAFWHEGMSGRAGNHIASALTKILYAVAEANPTITKLVLWSDSCVPQNRNKVMSTAIKQFLQDERTSVNTIEQKFSEAGHGLIQEVDAVHSKIERAIKNMEIFSPVSLLRKLLSLPAGKAPLKLIQMKAPDFKNYQVLSSGYNFSDVPYTKVKHLVYKEREPFHLGFRNEFGSESVSTIRLNRLVTPRARKTPSTATTPPNLLGKVGVVTTPVTLSDEKMRDLRSMYRFMPSVDVDFYVAIFGKN